MTSILRYIPNLYAKGIGALSKNKYAQMAIGMNAPAAIGTITTLSCATKDAVNCGFYVWQSMTNEKIPEDKRSFVAGMDLANGILNVALQIATGLWFNKKVLPKIFEKHVEPRFFGDALKNMVKRLPVQGLKPEAVEKVVSGMKKAGEAGLAAAATLILTQILIKRVVVPLIATPCAAWFKEYSDKRHKNNTNMQDTVTFSQSPQNSQIVPNVKNEKLPDCFKNFVK